LANVYGATSRQAEAEAAYETARGLQAGLAAEFPSAPDYRQQLSITLMRLANVQRNRGNLPQAIETVRVAIELRAKLVAGFGRTEYKTDLAAARNTLGTMLRQSVRYVDAAASYSEALAVWKDLAAAAPDNPDYTNDIAGELVNIAQVRLAQGAAAVARRLLDDAVPYHTAALKVLPRHSEFLRFYRNNRETYLHALVVLGDHAAAAAAAEDLVRNAIEPKDHVTAAAGLSGCSYLAERDESLPSAKRTAVAADYADRAVAMLRQAVAKGFRDTPGVSRDARFAPVRDRADVQALLKSMSESSKP